MPIPLAPQPPPSPLWMWYLPLAGLLLAALLGAVWAYRVLRDLKGDGEDDEAVRPKDLFSPLYEAYRSGQMSEEEYRRIRQSLEAAGGDLGLVPPLPRTRAETAPSPAPTPKPRPGDPPGPVVDLPPSPSGDA